MLAREALVNAKIIEIARSSSLWRADDTSGYKLCLLQIEMFLFPVPFVLFVDPKCVRPEATEGEGERDVIFDQLLLTRSEYGRSLR